jgi:hypothetical protein
MRDVKCAKYHRQIPNWPNTITASNTGKASSTTVSTDGKGTSMLSKTASYGFGRVCMIFITAALLIGIGVGKAQARNCYDGKYYTFYNNDNFNDCVSIGWANGHGTKNFCLVPGDSERIEVRSGDRACWAGGDYAPSNNNCFSLTQERC